MEDLTQEDLWHMRGWARWLNDRGPDERPIPGVSLLSFMGIGGEQYLEFTPEGKWRPYFWRHGSPKS